MDDTTEYKTDDPRLRAAVLSGFGGRCFYTGQEVTEDNMAIDHVVPKDKGGKDSILNYALTTKLFNNHKATVSDEEEIKPILYIIETVYAPRVLKRLQDKKWKSVNNGLRKQIYVPNEQIWQEIQETAKLDGRSVSNYLVTLHQVSTRARDRKAKGFIDEAGSIPEEVYEKIKPAENRKGVTNKIQTTLQSFSKDSQLGKK